MNTLPSNVREIFIVLTGKKWDSQPDPRLTPEGEEQALAAASQALLPPTPALVISGTGRLYRQTAKVFNMEPDIFNILCGSADSSAPIAGKGRVVRFADGETCPIAKYQVLDTKPFLRSLDHNTVLIAGRAFMLGLDYRGAKDGMIFKVTLNAEGLMPMNDIEEIVQVFPGSQALKSESLKSLRSAVTA